MQTIAKFWRNNKGVILFIFLMLFFRSAIADWYHVPSGSMKPNILIGDRVWVDKLAYDVKIPLTEINLNRHNEPQRGDVVVFNSKTSDDRLIKRVIAIPGDLVEMRNQQLFINQQPLELEIEKSNEVNNNLASTHFYQLREKNYAADTLDARSYPVQFNSRENYLGSFAPVVVPTDHLWVMGDNRDNSADSRVIGLVPRSELVGRATRVLVSFDKNNYYLPRAGRYLEKL